MQRRKGVSNIEGFFSRRKSYKSVIRVSLAWCGWRECALEDSAEMLFFIIIIIII